MTDHIRAAKDRSRRQRRAAHGPLWVDPTPAREHIAALRRFGLGHRAIAHLTGLSDRLIEQTVSPGESAYRKWIHRDTEAAILAARFDLDALAPHHQIDSCGTVRRIRALARMGWSQTYLAQRLGISVQGVAKFLQPNKRYITVRNARAVRDLYDELAWQWGPSTAFAKTAQARGWPIPLAWDDETIDDPAAEPLDTTRPARRTLADTAAELEDLLDLEPGTTTEQAARRLGYDSAEHLHRALGPDRANRPDLLERLTRNADLAGHPVRRTA